MYLKGPISAQPLHASQWAARGADGGRSLYLNQDAGKGSQDAFPRVSRLRPTGAMESEFPGEDSLLQKLRDSHHRFQRHMQQLLEKVRTPTGPLGGAGGREAGGKGENGAGDRGKKGSGGEGRWRPGRERSGRGKMGSGAEGKERGRGV